jgi:TonB-linked SusC/RagA family outer membrane protein
MKHFCQFFGLLLLLLWADRSTPACAALVQQGRSGDVAGIVTDSKGQPLAGVEVRLKGRNQNTFTQAGGHFKLNAAAADTLEFRRPGLSTVIAIVGNNTFFQITMRPDMQQLQEVSVVSTGYQTLRRESATGSFEKIGTSLYNRSVGTDVLGRLDGVSGILFDRRPGQQNTPVIRGKSTLFGNSQPLIVVDNFPYNGDINNINPNDVESITILKDASAASIWGVRASNGVIVITTKKGGRNKPLLVSFNANVTIAEKPDALYLPRMSSADFVDVEKMLFDKGFYTSYENAFSHLALSPVVETLIAQREGQINADAANAQIMALAQHDVRDDLQKYWYRQAVNQQYALNLSGGSDKSTYLFSAGYDHNLTALDGSFQRLNLRSDNSFYLLKNLQLDIGTYITDSRTVTGRSDAGSLVSADGRQLYPYASLADAGGKALPVNLDYRGSFIQSSQKAGFEDWSYRPLDDYKNIDNHSNQLDLLLNTALKYTLFPGLQAEFRYQLESAQTQGTLLYGANSYYARNVVNQYTQTGTGGTLTFPVPPGGIMKTSDTKMLSNSIRAQLNYNHSWNRHQLSALAGYEYRNVRTENRAGGDYGYNADTQSGLPVDYLTDYPLSNYSYFFSSTVPFLNNYQTDRIYNLSYFANAAYTFDKRYTLSASARKDESNIFGVNANQKGVPLYSVGGAWTATNESFFQAGWLPLLKLRASYGYGGNVDNTLAAQTTITYAGQDPLGKQRYAIINNPPNPDLGWEKTRIINLGLDFGLLHDVISGSIDYYAKKSTDLIGFQPVDQTTGVLNPATLLFQYKGNVAEMQGKGLEINLHSNNLPGPLKWQTDLLFNYAKSKITRYYQYGDLAAPYVGDGLLVSPLVGKAPFAILTYKWAGLDGQTGDPQGYVNGQISKDYNAILTGTKVGDLQYNGSAVPQVYGSLRNTFTYKSISLSALISYKFDYYFLRRSPSYSALFSNNDTESGDYARRWQKPGDEQRTNVPSLVYPANSQRDQFYNQASVNVEKGDNIRLQDLRVAWDADQRNIKKLLFKHIQVYLYVNNIGIIWKATKTTLDPDSPFSMRLPNTVALGFSGNF